MPQESSFQLPEPPQFPQAVLSRFPEMRDYALAQQRWFDRVAFTLRQEFDEVRDRLDDLESP
jgi:hypothetical protein